MDLEALNKLKTDYEAALREKGQEIMGGAVKDFFAKNPLIKAVTWQQYTPYFNDGDECIFGVREPAFAVEPITEVPDRVDEGSAEGPFFSGYAFHLYTEQEVKEGDKYAGSNYRRMHNEEVAAVREQIGSEKVVAIERAGESWQNTVGAAPDDLFQAAFGNHVSVLLTPEGAKTEQYDHD